MSILIQGCSLCRMAIELQNKGKSFLDRSDQLNRAINRRNIIVKNKLSVIKNFLIRSGVSRVFTSLNEATITHALEVALEDYPELSLTRAFCTVMNVYLYDPRQNRILKHLLLNLANFQAKIEVINNEEIRVYENALNYEQDAYYYFKINLVQFCWMLDCVHHVRQDCGHCCHSLYHRRDCSEIACHFSQYESISLTTLESGKGGFNIVL